MLLVLDCPDGFDVRNDIVGSCYMLMKTLRTWNDAKSFCEQQNSYMVAIETEYENKFLVDTIANIWGKWGPTISRVPGAKGAT